jgi:hypothetical protein
MTRSASDSSILGLSVLVLAAATAAAQVTGFTPLNDLETGTYLGFQGGLYSAGQNVPPPAHAAAAVSMAAQVVPRDETGAPDPDGWIVLIAIGMSNTNQEFAAFERRADLQFLRNGRVVIIDTAVGGQTATEVADPNAPYWSIVAGRLAAMGLASAQVQLAWLKEAEAGPTDPFPAHALGLRDNLELICNNLHDKFVNLRLCYLSSRTFGGYATGPLNPEPYAYESGFSVKWLIEDQINGDPGLNYGALPGPIRSPLLLWGPYLWADGVNPRSDGLVWLQSDFESDGTHPSPAGEQKVASLLSAFFAGEPSAADWLPIQPLTALSFADANADATVDAALPNTNFGSAPDLRALNGVAPVRAYVRFDLRGINRPILRAKLSLRVTDGATGGAAVALVDDSSWGENTITYATAPPAGAVHQTIPDASRESAVSADVTAAVNADPDQIVSFVIVAAGSNGARRYHSRQTEQPPRLILTVAGEPLLPGDLNRDGCVDNVDLQRLLDAWRHGPGGDANHDGYTDNIDLQILLTDWARCLP